jgi:hypothetical protein
MKSSTDEYVLVILDGQVIDYDNIRIQKDEENVQSIGGVTKNGLTNYQIEILTEDDFYLQQHLSPTIIIYTKDLHYRFENCQFDSQEVQFSPQGTKRIASFWAPGPTEATQGWQE